MRPPEIRSGLTFFKVILRNHTLMDEKALSWLGQHEDAELSDQQKMGLAPASWRQRPQMSRHQ